MKVVGIFWASKGFSLKNTYETVLVIKGSWETWESGSSFTASARGPFTHLLPYSLSQILAAPEQHRSPRGLRAGSGPQDLSGSGICWCCFLSNKPLPAEAVAPVVTIPVGGQEGWEAKQGAPLCSHAAAARRLPPLLFPPRAPPPQPFVPLPLGSNPAPALPASLPQSQVLSGSTLCSSLP